jgi:hypothetical protein
MLELPDKPALPLVPAQTPRFDAIEVSVSHIPDSSSIDDGPQQRVGLRSTLSNTDDAADQPWDQRR